MSDASIKFQCPHCRKVTRVPAEYAGRQGRCPKCKRAIEVPGERPSPAQASRDTVEIDAPEPEQKQAARGWRLNWTHPVIAVLVVVAAVVVGGKVLEGPTRSENVSGPAFDYNVIIPEGHDPSRPAPLILCLHPHGYGWAYADYLGPFADRHGVIVAGSNDFRNHIDGDEFLPRLEATLDDLTTRYAIDEEQIYLVGFSGGGMGCYVTAHHIDSHPFAAIISNSGGLHHYMIEHPEHLKELHTKRVVILSSPTDDVQTPQYLKNDKQLLEGAGLKVDLISFLGGHRVAPHDTYDEAWELLRRE